jgi:hypothetical protein
MNILEVCPIIRLCRVLGSVRLGRSVTERPFPKKQERSCIEGANFYSLVVLVCKYFDTQQSLPVRKSMGSLPSPRARSPPSAHTPRRIAARPIISPGFEVEAAQMTAAAALTGIAVRRSTRSRTQPSAWWAVQPATAPAGPQEGSSASHRWPEQK